MAEEKVEPTATETTEQEENPNIYKLNVGKLTIPINLGYIKSQNGILVIVSLVLSLITAICVSATYVEYCDQHFGSSYNFLEFVSVSWFVITLVRFLIFVLSLEGTLCFKFIPWLILELILLAVYVFMFLISSAVTASRSCFQDGYKAAAAFGFLCMVAIVLDCINTFIRLRKEHPPTDNKILLLLGVQRASPSTVPEYDPEGNVENRY